MTFRLDFSNLASPSALLEEQSGKSPINSFFIPITPGYNTATTESIVEVTEGILSASPPIPDNFIPKTPGFFSEIPQDHLLEVKSCSSTALKKPEPLYNLDSRFICVQPQSRKLHGLIIPTYPNYANLPALLERPISSPLREQPVRFTREEINPHSRSQRNGSMKLKRKYNLWRNKTHLKLFFDLCNQNPQNFTATNSNCLEEIAVIGNNYWTRIAEKLSELTGKKFTADQCSKKYFKAYFHEQVDMNINSSI